MPGMDLPDVTTKTVPNAVQQKIEITYKNKQKLVLDHIASKTRLSDLVKKIEEPARALRLKEEGL